MRTHFKLLPIGTLFRSNGNSWVKQSSRTARLSCTTNLWFYFSKDETVTVKAEE